MRVKNCNKNTIIVESCKIADNFASRFKGLMGTAGLEPGNGLLIVPCNSIHMFFMKYPIDAVFLDKDNIVTHIIRGLKPWRISPAIKKAHSVLELPTGTVSASRTEIGDRLELSARC